MLGEKKKSKKLKRLNDCIKIKNVIVPVLARVHRVHRVRADFVNNALKVREMYRPIKT